MSVFHENMLIGASGQGAAGPTAGRSVRFNSADSAYLSRTPASAGNRKTWTWSGWVKRTKLSTTNQALFYSYASADNAGYTGILFSSGDELRVVGFTTTYRVTTQLFRDPSAWYHVVVAFDTTQATAANRIKVYVNGSEITTFSTSDNPTQNQDLGVNTAAPHALGYNIWSGGQLLDGYLALVHFIDGQALTPSSFGETSATTGQWIAKTYSGSYGTNGFFLDFLDNSTAAALGYDAAGSNDWTVNNLIVGPTTTTNDSWSGYFDGNGDYLTLSSNASMSFGTGTFTIEGWFLTTDKSLSVGAGRTLIGNSGNSYTSQLYITTNGYITFGNTGSTFLQGSTNLADASWHHVAVSRSGTGSNQIAMWVDGTRVALGTNAENYTSGTIYIGAFDTANGYWNGYISNLRIVKGSSVYDPSSSTITVPTSPLTAITNTALLICKSSTFVDNSTNAYTVTANGNARVSRDGPFEIFSDSDSLRDHPTSAGTSTGLGGEVSGNYATLNPLDKASTTTLANGNLDYSTSGAGGVRSTIGMSSGKYYAEVTVGHASLTVGIATSGAAVNNYLGANVGEYGYGQNGYKLSSAGQFPYGNTFTTGDVIGIAFDADNGSLYFYKNGTVQNSGTAAFTGLTSGPYFFAISNNVPTSTCNLNFGQRAFAYTAPSGFSPLVDTLLPTPTIAKPNTVMDVKLYTGNGSTQTISGLGFSPDFVWIKDRSAVGGNWFSDIVRGSTALLRSDTTAAENTVSTSVTGFTSDGFTLGSAGGLNTNGNAHVAWTFDAGSSNATNTSGTITSTVRANISAGFSIVTYTGNGTAGATIGHGLGVAPELLIIKPRSTTGDWIVYSKVLGNNKSLFLDLTLASTTTTNFNNTTPSSTVFTVSSSGEVNGNGTTYVAYCWAPVAGYSAFGSYTGNGSSDGPFVALNFEPKVVIIKRTDTAYDWSIIDNSRPGYNLINKLLYPNLSDAEGTTSVADFLGNGFKIRSAGGQLNASAGTYVYAAWASAPFPYARAR